MILRGQIPPSKYFSCPRKTLPRKPKNFTKKSKKNADKPKRGQGTDPSLQVFLLPKKIFIEKSKKITKKSKKFHQEILRNPCLPPCQPP